MQQSKKKTKKNTLNSFLILSLTMNRCLLSLSFDIRWKWWRINRCVLALCNSKPQDVIWFDECLDFELRLMSKYWITSKTIFFEILTHVYTAQPHWWWRFNGKSITFAFVRAFILIFSSLSFFDSNSYTFMIRFVIGFAVIIWFVLILEIFQHILFVYLYKSMQMRMVISIKLRSKWWSSETSVALRQKPITNKYKLWVVLWSHFEKRPKRWLSKNARFRNFPCFN